MTSPAAVTGAPATHATDQACREAFARLPAAVSVITTDGPRGAAGMTASAVCSLSLEPPLVLVCFASHSRTLGRIRDHGTFAVNVLREEQAAVAETFADPDRDQHSRFATVPHHRDAGAVVLDDALIWLACRVQGIHPGGDHTIVTGRIHSLGATRAEPLIWYGRRFRTLA